MAKLRVFSEFWEFMKYNKKFWLAPIRLARSYRVDRVELNRIEAAVFEHEAFFLEKWHEFFER